MINKKDLLLFDDNKLYTMKEVINILNLPQITYLNQYVKDNRLKPCLKKKQGRFWIRFYLGKEIKRFLIEEFNINIDLDNTDKYIYLNNILNFPEESHPHYVDKKTYEVFYRNKYSGRIFKVTWKHENRKNRKTTDYKFFCVGSKTKHNMRWISYNLILKIILSSETTRNKILDIIKD